MFAKQRVERAQNFRQFILIYFTMLSDIHSLYSTEVGDEYKGRIRTAVLMHFKHSPNIYLQLQRKILKTKGITPLVS